MGTEHYRACSSLETRLLKLEALVKRISAIFSEQVEEVLVKTAIPAMVEAMSLKIANEMKALIPTMVEELQKELGHKSFSKSLPRQHVGSSKSKCLKLHFVGELPDTLLTHNNIQDEGAALKVELRDSSGSVVEVGSEASMKIKICVLDGDFEVDDTDDWTREEFDKNVAHPRKDRGPLLKGKCDINLNRGVANVSDIAFTDNSKSMRNGKFRLGARVVKGVPVGVEVRYAVSEAFKVKERRVKFYRKHRRPSLEDDVECLMHVGKMLRHKLADGGIDTVKDFLQLYHIDADRLQNILHLASNKWSELIKIAELCPLSDEYYRYHDETYGVHLLLDCVFNVVRVLFNGRESQAYADLDESQKKLVEKIRLAAYERRKDLHKFHSSTIPTSMEAEYDCRSIITHSDMQILDTIVADRTPPILSINFDVDNSLEGQDICRVSPKETDQDRGEPYNSSKEDLPRNSIPPEELQLSLMPPKRGMQMLVDQAQNSDSQNQSCVTFTNDTSCQSGDERFRSSSMSEFRFSACSNETEDRGSHCSVDLKRPRLGYDCTT